MQTGHPQGASLLQHIGDSRFEVSMQYDPNSSPPPIRPRPTRPRLVSINDEQQQQYSTRKAQGLAPMSLPPGSDIAMQSTVILPPTPTPTPDQDRTTSTVADRFHFRPLPVTDEIDDISQQSTMRLMQLSGMMPVIKMPPGSGNGVLPSTVLPAPASTNTDQEEGYWPYGIHQTGALPVVNLYGSKPFGQTLPQTPVAAVALPALPSAAPRPGWRVALSSPAAKITFGLVIGVVLLFLVGIFLNFLLPIRGGEVAKSLMLKRIANIPVSKSLPTVAMDKALDL